MRASPGSSWRNQSQFRKNRCGCGKHVHKHVWNIVMYCWCASCIRHEKVRLLIHDNVNGSWEKHLFDFVVVSEFHIWNEGTRVTMIDFMYLLHSHFSHLQCDLFSKCALWHSCFPAAILHRAPNDPLSPLLSKQISASLDQCAKR